MIYVTTGAPAVAAANAWLPVLRRSLEDADGRWTEEALLEDVRECNLQVWIKAEKGRIEAVFTTRLLMSARVKWLVVEDLAGDDMADWLLEASSAIEAWAREHQATQIMIEGRRGWARVLRGLGYETRRIQAVKHLRTYQ